MTITDPSAFGSQPSGEDDPSVRLPLVEGAGENFSSVTDAVASIAELPVERTNRAWIICFAISVSLLGMLGLLILHLITTGVGVWGNNNPAYWGWPIVNFVFWVGIGHAGTLISAILFLTRQNWRTGVNRAAEAMTIFAVVCAGTFPGIHIGRVWVAYWLFPLPNQMAMWPNFRSPLLWDVFAVSTYATVSLLFWYMGMVPDLATFRDRAVNNTRRIAYGIFSLGWTGSSRHWHVYERAYLLLAALATPLVLSVHSVVSFDFAVSQLPGWHTTIFPPYFVAGAIFSGFAMVLTLMIPARQFFGLKHIITMRHIDVMCRILMATGLMVGYAYSIEFFVAWYGGVQYESFAFVNRAFGNYWWAYWIMVSCNVLIPQVFWSKKLRGNLWVVMIVSITTNIGMWFERFVIAVTSLTRDFVPSSWGYFSPTWVDITMFIGSFGLFFTLFLLFLRFLPVVAIAEVKTVLPQAHAHGEDHAESHSAGGSAAAPASRHDA
ncbi:MAG: polysulfide reductase NrfD [Planctomycetota bacterium]|nr:polysulfide reductase NrfD [Planctomycetota bacterium]